MRKLLSFNLLMALALVFASCGTNNNVVNNRLISKRKFNKGFHINTKGNMKSSNDKKQEENIASDDSKKREGYNKKIERRNKERAAELAAAVASTESTAKTVEEQNRPNESYETTQTEDARVSDAVDSDMIELEDRTEDQNNRVSEKEAAKESKKSKKSLGGGGVDGKTILLVILAIILAPLAVFIYEGASNRFWITLILWLVGVGVGYFLFGPALAWACGLVAAIYAILIVLGII